LFLATYPEDVIKFSENMVTNPDKILMADSLARFFTLELKTTSAITQ